MLTIVGKDNDGHFFVVPYSDRPKIEKTLRSVVEDGDTWRNNVQGEPDIANMKEDELTEFLYNNEFVSRGLMEIKDIQFD